MLRVWISGEKNLNSTFFLRIEDKKRISFNIAFFEKSFFRLFNWAEPVDNISEI